MGTKTSKQQKTKVTTSLIKTPEPLTVPKDHKSASMTPKELIKIGRLCLLQGSKKLGEASSKEALCNLLCSGLESGPYGSITIHEFVKPPKLDFRTDKDQIFRHLDYPMNEGGALLVYDKYEYAVAQQNRLYLYRLDLDALLIGLARLSLDHPQVYAQWIGDRADALTGDALIQCALFGDIVYG